MDEALQPPNDLNPDVPRGLRRVVLFKVDADGENVRGFSARAGA
jgi:hypothetical protein